MVGQDAIDTPIRAVAGWSNQGKPVHFSAAEPGARATLADRNRLERMVEV